jgi:hypothetical protein
MNIEKNKSPCTVLTKRHVAVRGGLIFCAFYGKLDALRQQESGP